MIKDEDKAFISAILTVYTLLVSGSLCLLLVSAEVSIFFTTIWLMFTLIVVGAIILTCVSNVLLKFYGKLLGKGN